MTDAQHKLPQTISLLSQTPATLDALLRNLTEALTQANEGEGTWTPLRVVAHLNHCERRDWLLRAREILTIGESRPFEPLDRTAGDSGSNLCQLLDEFAQLRAANLAELRSLNLQPEDLAKRGLHPAFGPVTLSQLLATWATHDLTHLHQLSRILAYQYRDAVGPWKRYLGVLHCDGHSAP